MYKFFRYGRPVDHTPPAYWKLGKFLWMIFGNSDDPEPEHSYPSGWSQGRKRLHWLFVRNPLHNFSWYFIGVADKDRWIEGKAPEAHFVDGWNFTITRIKHVRLPYLSYRKGRFQFYFGWRPSGAFGFKCRRV